MSNFHPDQSPHFDLRLGAPPGQFAYPPQHLLKRPDSSDEVFRAPYSSNNLPYFMPTLHAYFQQTFPLTHPQSTTSLPLVPTSPFLISPSTGITPALLKRLTNLDPTETISSLTSEVEKDAKVAKISNKRSWSSSTTTLCGADSENEEDDKASEKGEVKQVIKRRRRKTFSCKSCRYVKASLRKLSAGSFLSINISGNVKLGAIGRRTAVLVKREESLVSGEEPTVSSK